MAVLSLDQFSKAIVAAGLMSADDLKAIWGGWPAAERPKDAAALAQRLVELKKFNEFQAKELLEGRGARLVMGDYALLAKIGEGGMGQVFKAQHRRMNRIVALKVMSAAAMKDEAAIKRFQREVHAAARLEHPNIVTAYDSGEAGNVKYLVMQFVDGGDLSDLVKKNGPLPVERAVNYVLQTARGLAFAHGEGVIHRDIKPANLLLDKKGVVKILDMGLARIENGDDGLTATEQVMGTVDYMSPEQASNTKTADARADIYSLGCTLWFLLTGKKTYDGDSMIMRLMAHRDAPLPSLVKTRDDAPWALEQALHKMIAKRADDRYQTMDELVAALEPFAGGGGATSGMGSSIGQVAAPNAELSAFLKTVETGPKTQAKPAASATNVAADATAQFLSTDVETDPKSEIRIPTIASVAKPQATSGVSRDAKRSAAGGKKPPNKNLLLAAAGGGALLVLLGVWFIFRGPNGEEVARVQMPAGGSVTIANEPRPSESGGVAKPTPTATGTFFTAGVAPAGATTFQSTASPSALQTRWPLAASQPADIRWLLGLGAQVTLRVAMPAINSSADRTITTAAEIPPGAATIVGVELHGTSGPTTDADLARISSFVDLETLAFAKGSKNEITNQGWSKASALKNLRRLTLEGDWKQVVLPDFMASLSALEHLRMPYDADEWARAAATAPALKTLIAYRSQLSDEGLALLEKRASLREIDLRSAHLVTQAGIDRFTAAMPQCRITWGNEKNPTVIEPRMPSPSAADSAAAAPPPGDYVLDLRGHDQDSSWVDVPSLLLAETGPLTLETRVWAVGHNEGFVLGTADLRLRISGRQWTTDRVRLQPTNIEYNRWYHLAAVRTDGELRMYVDGKRTDAQTLPSRTGPQPPPKTLPLKIGGNNANIRVDEIRISRTARYDQDFTPPTTPFTPDADTLALYHCNDGAGDVLKDASGNGHDGKITKPHWVLPDGSPIPLAAASPASSPLSVAELLESPDYVWTEPENLGPTVNGPGDQSIRSLTNDELRLYFHRKGGADGKADEICEVVRTSREAPFGELQVVNNGGGYVSGDGLTYVFAGPDISMRQRPSLESPFGEAINLGPVINSPGDERRPTLSPDGLTLVFGSNRDIQQRPELWMSRRASQAEAFLPPTKFGPAVNAGKSVFMGQMFADGQTLLFRSTDDLRLSFVNPTGIQSSLPLRDHPFAASNSGDLNVWIAPDGRTAYFNADRPGGLGGMDIYVTRRVPKNGVAATPIAVPNAPVAGEPGPSPLTVPDLLLSPDYEWTSPENLGPTVNGPGDEAAASFTNDQLRMFYQRKNHPEGGHAEAVRSNVSAPFGPPTAMSIPGNRPYLSGDGLSLVVASGEQPSGIVEMFRRPTLADKWSGASVQVRGTSEIHNPTLSPDGLALLFRSEVDPKMKTDLWVCRRAKQADLFGPAANVGPPVSTPNDEPFGLVLADGRSLLYRSHRTWYVATTSPTGVQTVTPLPPDSNGNGLQSQSTIDWLSPDGLTAYFSADLPGGLGGLDIYVTRRVPKAGTAAVAPIPLGDSPGAKTNAAAVVYLDDLPEKEWNGFNDLGKHGEKWEKGSQINWNDAKPAHALTTYPLTDGAATVTYELSGRYSTFEATIGVVTRPQTPLIFRVSGDGKVLWESLPQTKDKSGVDFKVDLQGVDQLKLEVFCRGDHKAAHAVWINPRLTSISLPAQPLSVAELLDSPDYVWTDPENLGPTINGPGGEDNVSLTGDQLRIVFRRKVGPEAKQFDLCEAVRYSTMESFGPPRVVSNLQSFHSYVASDGLTLVKAQQGPENKDDLSLLRRAKLDEPFGEATDLGPQVNGPGDDKNPTLSPDGLTLVFSSNRAATSNSDLWISRRKNQSESFGPAETFGSFVNTPDSENKGLLLADDSTLVFHRNDGGWRMTFTNSSGKQGAILLRDHPFGTSTNVWLAPDGRTAYFSADRPGGLGSQDIYVTRRVPKPGVNAAPSESHAPSSGR